MADDISQKKKPLWRKWWFWTIIGVVLVLGVIGSQEGSSETPESTVPATTVPTSSSQSNAASSSPSGADQDPAKVLDSVAQAAGMEVVDSATFRPDEEYRQNGPYKRGEYRLPAFQGSSGVHATINGVPVDVVVYHQSSSHFVRIYATGDENTVLSVYSAAAGVFDSSLSDSDLQSAIAKYRSSEVKDSRDALSALSSDGKIRSDYIMGSGSNCEIFIDAEA